MKDNILMLIDALMSYERLESLIVGLTDGYAIKSDKYNGLDNIYLVLWNLSRFNGKTSDEDIEEFDNIIYSEELSNVEKYDSLFDF